MLRETTSLSLSQSLLSNLLLDNLDSGGNDILVHLLLVPHSHDLVRLDIVVVFAQFVVFDCETEGETDKRSEERGKKQRLECFRVGGANKLSFGNFPGDGDTAKDLAEGRCVVDPSEVFFELGGETFGPHGCGNGRGDCSANLSPQVKHGRGDGEVLVRNGTLGSHR